MFGLWGWGGGEGWALRLTIISFLTHCLHGWLSLVRVSADRPAKILWESPAVCLALSLIAGPDRSREQDLLHCRLRHHTRIPAPRFRLFNNQQIWHTQHCVQFSVLGGGLLSISIASFVAARAAPRTQLAISDVGAQAFRRESLYKNFLRRFAQVFTVHLLEHSSRSFDLLNNKTY